MKVWIEQCKQSNNGRLSWYGVSTLVKEAECRGYTNITHREIDLAYGLKYGQESIFTHTTYFFEYYIDAYGVFFFLIFIIS